MIKKTVKFTDFNGEECTEDCYFNINKAELLDMEMAEGERLSVIVPKIVEEKDTAAMYRIFRDIIKKAYGKKSDDGKRFVKSEELLNNFIQSEAYSELLMSLVTNDKEAADFINNVIPKDLDKYVKKEN